jgi:hypothetical protein
LTTETPQVEVLVDSNLGSVSEASLQHCAAALLLRTAAAGERGRSPLAALAADRVCCRAIGPARAAIAVAALPLAVLLAALLCLQLAAALSRIPLASTLPRLATTARRVCPLSGDLGPSAAGAGPTPTRRNRLEMMSPVQTPVDPAVAVALLHLCTARAASDMELLGVGPARGGSVGVRYCGDRVLPDHAGGGALFRAIGRRGLRRVRAAAALAGLGGGAGTGRANGTRSLLRTAAVETVRSL